MPELSAAAVAELCDRLVLAPRETTHGAAPVSPSAAQHASSSSAWETSCVPALLALLRSEGAELWLDRRIRESGRPAPDALTAALRERVKKLTVSNMRIDEQTTRIAQLLSSVSLPWALIKGQARRAAATLYPYANGRTISDVDLLVPADSARASWDLLCANGFSRLYEDSPWIVADHHLPVICDAQGVAVELHTTTMLTVPPHEAWRRATEQSVAISWNGLDVRVPSATELVWQALAGGAADGIRGFELRAFLSLASVLAIHPVIDWDTIEQRITSGEVRDLEVDRVVSRERILRYLDIAARFAAFDLDRRFRPARPANIRALLSWRARIHAMSPPRAVAERLLEEGLRVEAAMELTPGHRLASRWKNGRRRSTSFVARTIYTTWRSVLAAGPVAP
ncbi:MAG: nucleotidyltransferase family protein [Gemmatimonadaceae bacterium]|nr:nucleotidyltransferase family protein [Gemmatimonadaceae bacterium]